MQWPMVAKVFQENFDCKMTSLQDSGILLKISNDAARDQVTATTRERRRGVPIDTLNSYVVVLLD